MRTSEKKRIQITGRYLMHLGCTVLAPLVLALLNPLGMTVGQNVVFCSTILTIIWWVSGTVSRTVVSLFLLGIYFVFSGGAWETVLSFPLSENFWLITISFVFSQGIVNSGLIEKLIQPLIRRCANRALGLILFVVVLEIGMLFLIPQPFSRVILVALIFSEFLDAISVEGELKRTLMFWTFACTAFTNMLFKRGDIVQNGALLGVSGMGEMSEGTWLLYMGVPTIVLTILGVGYFLLRFGKSLKTYPKQEWTADGEKGELTRAQRGNLILIGAVVLIWAFESVHGISGVWIVLAGTALMVVTKLITWADRHAINPELLIFLTAAFSIGGVLNVTGVADVVFGRLTQVFPTEFSALYVVIVILVSMGLHMILGSNITTMSVAVPGLLQISQGVAPQEIILFIVYISICCHYVLPFHNVSLLLGAGKGYYTNAETMKFGLTFTPLLILGILCLYIPWWTWMGLL